MLVPTLQAPAAGCKPRPVPKPILLTPTNSALQSRSTECPLRVQALTSTEVYDTPTRCQVDALVFASAGNVFPMFPMSLPMPGACNSARQSQTALAHPGKPAVTSCPGRGAAFLRRFDV